MTRTIQKYGLSCLVFIVVYCLIYFTTQAMRMNEQESLFLSVFSGLFLSANSKLILRQNSLKNHKVQIVIFYKTTPYSRIFKIRNNYKSFFSYGKGSIMDPVDPWTQNDAADKVLIRLCQRN